MLHCNTDILRDAETKLGNNNPSLEPRDPRLPNSRDPRTGQDGAGDLVLFHEAAIGARDREHSRQAEVQPELGAPQFETKGLGLPMQPAMGPGAPAAALLASHFLAKHSGAGYHEHLEDSISTGSGGAHGTAC